MRMIRTFFFAGVAVAVSTTNAYVEFREFVAERDWFGLLPAHQNPLFQPGDRA